MKRTTSLALRSAGPRAGSAVRCNAQAHGRTARGPTADPKWVLAVEVRP